MPHSPALCAPSHRVCHGVWVAEESVRWYAAHTAPSDGCVYVNGKHANAVGALRDTVEQLDASVSRLAAHVGGHRADLGDVQRTVEAVHSFQSELMHTLSGRMHTLQVNWPARPIKLQKETCVCEPIESSIRKLKVTNTTKCSWDPTRDSCNFLTHNFPIESSNPLIRPN